MPRPYPRASGFYGEQVAPRVTSVLLGNREFGQLPGNMSLGRARRG
jgi:hypothetical protein